MFRLFKKQPEPVHLPVDDDVRVAVEVEKSAHKEVAAKAKQATGILNELLEANHFHIKIYRAAGGKQQPALKPKGNK